MQESIFVLSVCVFAVVHVHLPNQIQQEPFRLRKVTMVRKTAVERPDKRIAVQLAVNAGSIITEEAMHSKVRNKRKSLIQLHQCIGKMNVFGFDDFAGGDLML